MNILRKSGYFLLVLLIALLVTSCQKTASVGSEKEYLSGYRYGEEIAKEDALDTYCGDVSTNRSYGHKLATQYVNDLNQTNSDSYVKGFLWGYESSFDEHIRIYCPIPKIYGSLDF